MDDRSVLRLDTKFYKKRNRNSLFQNIPFLPVMRQIDGFAKQGDVVIGISTSGNSRNVYLALALAKQKGCFTAALLGKDGGTIKNIVDLPLVVKWPNTPRVQECHIFIGHSVCELVDRAF